MIEWGRCTFCRIIGQRNRFLISIHMKKVIKLRLIIKITDKLTAHHRIISQSEDQEVILMKKHINPLLIYNLNPHKKGYKIEVSYQNY